MKVSCPSCGTNYNLDDSRVPPGGAKLKCAKCQSTFPIRRDGGAGSGAPAAPRPAPAVRPGSAITATLKTVASASPAIPLPGAASKAPLVSDLNVATSPAIPLPGNSGPRPGTGSGFTLTAAVPLPGGMAAGSSSEVTSAGLPMPGAEDAPGAEPDGDGELPWDAESTRVATIPMPAAALRPGAAPRSTPAIPLPGAGSPAPLGASPPGGVTTTPGMPFARSPAPKSTSAIPLPGAGTARPSAPAIPLPPANPAADDGIDFADADLVEPPPSISAAVPLPAGRDSNESTQMVSGPRDFDFADATLAGVPPQVPAIGAAVPLPAGRDGNESTQMDSGPRGFDFGDADLLEPPPASAPPLRAPAISAAVPLPSGQDSNESTQMSSSPGGFDFGELPPPPEPPGPPAADEMDFSVDFGEAPSSPEPPSSPPSIEDLPAPVDAAPASRSAFDFTGPDEQTSTDQPQPAGTGTVEVNFGSDLPAPSQAAAPQDDLLDFGELPSSAPPDSPNLTEPPGDAPGGGLDFDFSPPPPPSSPAEPPPGLSFGQSDFGAPAPAPSSVVDPLEFDPTSRSSPTAPRDELEADLSAPIPQSTTGPADSLEMLSFIDDVAKQQDAPPPSRSSRVTRYHVRRRSGKVVGPFDEGAVVKMLQDGQLLGNEDISPDGESWAPMSSAPALAAAIQRMTSAPSRVGAVAGASTPGMAARSGPQAAGGDRLRQLYGGRMAAVAVVDGRQSSARLQNRLPLMVISGAVALVLLAGASLSFTRYGAFGMRRLFPARLSRSSPQYAQYQDARRAILQDTFKSYRESLDLTAKLLAGTEYPEVRAVWCQAVFYLQRRYAAATSQEQMDAQTALPRVELLGTKNAEVAKALAGRALAARSPAEALSVLLEAKARAVNESDRELDLLVAEAYASQGDPRNAEEALQRVLKADPSSAKALHALGNLKQASGKADEAAKAYAAALAADANHAISAVELAAVDLLVRHNDAEGLKVLEQALTPESESLLGPAERSRARALRGMGLAAQFKPKEAAEELEQALKLDPESVFAKAMLARVRLSQRDHKGALPLFKGAADREPNNLEYVEGYLLTLIGTGNMSEALAQVARANQRFPGNARIAFLYGRISDALDNAADAEGHYKRAIAADSNLYQANLALARFYLRFRRMTDAKPQLEEAEAKAPGDAAVHGGLGELDLAEGNLADARREFDIAVKLDPNQADSHLGLAKVAFAESRFEESLREADQGLALDEHLKEARLQRSLALWKLKRLDDAVEELLRARGEDPKSPRVLVTTGAVQLDKGNLTHAEAALLSALAMDPSNHEAHFYMARVRAKRLEYTQAIESMKSALERAPKRAAYHYELGLVYRDAKRLNEAIESWNTAVKLEPRHSDALEALGQAFLDRGELDRAVGSFDAALKADPSRTRILGLVGDCYFQAAKWNEAIARYQLALKADPKLVQVYYKLGRAFSEKGDHVRSIANYQRATTLDPDNAMPYYYLGYAYKERGRKHEAVAAFRDYLKRRPDAEDKKEIEDELYDLEQDYR